MKNYFDQIKKKINNEIDIENVEIIDNSYKHKGHKSFSPEKFHLHLKVKSTYLTTLSRIKAQKMIMKILSEDLKTRLHALEITIKK